MDWYSWLSKTNLDPTFQFEYALSFAQNQLQEEDLAYFDHEFLQSIGIYVAKHRIEIIKLARSDVRGKPIGLWRLVIAVSKTKKLFSKKIGKFNFRKNDPYPISGPNLAQNPWIGALSRINGTKDRRKVMRSGPLDRTEQDKFMVTSRNVSVSGPLVANAQERLTYPNWSPMVTTSMDRRAKERMDFLCRSPAVSFPVVRCGLSPNVKYCSSEKRGYDDSGAKSLWSLMFQDMKPT